MQLSINKCRKLELFKGDIINDTNKEYWCLIKVSPIAQEVHSDDTEVNQKVGVCDGIARIYPLDGLNEIRSENE